MSRLGIIYEKTTNKIVGYVAVSTDSDLELNYDPETQGMIELPIDHRAQYNQKDYRIIGKSLIRDFDPAP